MAFHFVVKLTAGQEYISYVHWSVTEGMDNQVQLPAGTRDFTLSYRVQTDSVAHPAPLANGYLWLSGQGLTLTTLHSAEVKNE
jgi:hypothetical protein